MSVRLVPGTAPEKHTAQPNRESWSVVAAVMAAYGGAGMDDLVAAVSQHRHPEGGAGFIRYCLKQGWLKEEGR